LAPHRDKLRLERLDAGMEFSGVDRGFDEQILCGRKLPTQLCILCSEGDEQAIIVLAHHRAALHPFRTNPNLFFG
jgi:hypothetical protein